MKNFLTGFKITSKEFLQEDKSFYKSLPHELFELIDLYGGNTFGNGIYRIHSFKSSIQWSLLLGEYFTSYQNKIYPFGFDWMGRQFCIDIENTIIFMFDPATLEDFKLEQNISKFHDEDLTTGILVEGLFNELLSFYKIKEILFDECLGYKRPLFLGGQDIFENYEKQNLEVYWHIESQLYNKIKDLPEGTIIDNIKID